MKKRKLILHLIAFFITVGSVLAFKVTRRITGSHRLYGTTSMGSSNCTRSTCFTSLQGFNFGKCHTVGGWRTAFIGTANTLWTDITRINLLKCAGPTRHWTHSN